MIEDNIFKCLEPKWYHPLLKGPCVCNLDDPFNPQTLDNSSLDFTFYSCRASLAAQSEILGLSQIPAVLYTQLCIYSWPSILGMYLNFSKPIFLFKFLNFYLYIL